MPASEERADIAGLRALAYPLRLRSLSLATAQPTSASEVAWEWGESQPNVGYPIRQPRAVGLLEVAEEESVRGGRAKRHRCDPGGGARLTAGSDTDFAPVAAVFAQESGRRGVAGDDAHIGTPSCLFAMTGQRRENQE